MSRLSTHRGGFLAAWLLLTTMLGPWRQVGADVVVLEGGRRLEGMVMPAPGNPDAIMLQDSQGRVVIDRSRIVSIEEEPPALDHRRIGDQFFRRGAYREALEAYEKSVNLEPGNKEYVERIESARLALEREAHHESVKARSRTEVLMDQIAGRIESGEFAEAERLLDKDLAALDPSDSLQPRIREMRRNLYKRWARERDDKLVPETAAQYYLKALELDPGDEESYNRLIEIWGRMPEKSEQVIEAQEIRLRVNAGDHVARKKLADLLFARGQFERAAAHYETIYKRGDFAGTEVEERLVRCLEALYLQEESKGEYAKALEHYKALRAYQPQAGEEKLHELQYRCDLATLAADDAEGRVKLVRGLREKGLQTLAKSETRALRERFPKDGSVRDLLRLYAQDAFNAALNAWNRQRYQEALTLAAQCISDYGEFQDIGESAQQILNMARIELEKESRRQTEIGMKHKVLGDEYYNKADYHIERMRGGTQYAPDPGSRILSDKDEALRNYTLALESYGKAVETWPTMDEVTRKELEIKTARARQMVAILTSGRPMSLPRTPTSLGR